MSEISMKIHAPFFFRCANVPLGFRIEMFLVSDTVVVQGSMPVVCTIRMAIYEIQLSVEVAIHTLFYLYLLFLYTTFVMLSDIFINYLYLKYYKFVFCFDLC